MFSILQRRKILPPDDGLSTLGRDKAKDYTILVMGSDWEYWLDMVISTLFIEVFSKLTGNCLFFILQ